MTLFIFAVGVLIFLMTVYGTVVAGGIKLTQRQLDQDPKLSGRAHLDPDSPSARDVIGAEF